jgi:hypothetical protein
VSFVRALVMAAAAVASVAATARADDPGVLTGAVGLYDLVSHRTHATEGRIAYRFGWGVGGGDGAFRGFKPFAGVMFASNDAMFGYGGLAAPFQWGRFEFEPSAGMGAYHRGNGLELGGTFEFHLGLGFAYALLDNVRVGAELTHISNAQTHRVNPGLNSALATVSLTFP